MPVRTPSHQLLRASGCLCLLTLVLLAGCARQPLQPGTSRDIPQPPAIVGQWQQYQELLTSIDHWQLQGKLGLQVPDHSGSVYVNWQQQQRDYAIHLSGPLGQGTTWIRGNDRGVELENSDGKISARTPEQLMLDNLGWWLPVSELHYWIRALPSPTASEAALQRNDDGTIAQLQQSGWTLQYSRYQPVEGWPLPGRVVAQRDDIRLTFIIKNWEFY